VLFMVTHMVLPADLDEPSLYQLLQIRPAHLRLGRHRAQVTTPSTRRIGSRGCGQYGYLAAQRPRDKTPANTKKQVKEIA
jgi:hypothetical protein